MQTDVEIQFIKQSLYDCIGVIVCFLYWKMNHFLPDALQTLLHGGSNLMVLFSIHSFISFNDGSKISNTTNHDRASPSYYRHSLLYLWSWLGANISEQYIDQLKVQMHLSGHCWIFFLFLKDVTFGYCSSAVEVHLSSIKKYK